MRTIPKLALTRITSKKARSGVICGAILLTIVLFMTVVSISVNMVSGYSLMLRLASGTDYHGYFRTPTFNLSGEELRDIVRASDDIAEAAISSNVASYALAEADVNASYNALRAVETENDLQHFYTDITDGRFPSDDTEILVNPLYFPNVRVGDTVGLYYSQLGETAGQTAYAEFTVSGLMKSRSDAQLQVILRHSDTLTETYGFSEQYLNVYFLFENRVNLVGKLDKIVNETLADYKKDGIDVHAVLNSAYLETSVREALNPANIFLIVFSVAVVFLCSFLLIYNIYSIALTQDMQSLGLLGVIGTTHKQLRRMIALESLLLFAVTVPVGLVAGYFIGWKMLSPILFTSLGREGLTFEFSLWIPLLTLLLTLFTLLWSATRPLNKLKTMTPVATVDYSPMTDLPKRYVRRKNFTRRNTTPNAGRLARYSISRNRKKTVITALSMSLSVILFMLIATLCDYMIEYTESHLQFADYIVKAGYTYRYENGIEEYTRVLPADGGRGLPEETVTAAENSVYTEKLWKIRTVMMQIPTPEKARESLGVLRNEYKWFDSYPELTKAIDGTLDILTVGIPDELFPNILRTEKEAFGNDADGYVVWETELMTTVDEYNPYQLIWFDDGDFVTINGHRYPVRRSTAILPTMDILDYLNCSGHRAVMYVPESVFLEEFGEGLTFALLINAKEDCYDLLRNDLTALNDNFTPALDEASYERAQAERKAAGMTPQEILSYSVDIDGRMDGFDEMKATVGAIQTVGYSLASMIFLVGVLNIVNTSLSFVTERRREFAMLEAVGMTDRQLLRMLLAESLYSGGVAVLITVLVGFPLILLIINTAMEALVPLNWLSGVGMLGICIAVSLVSGTLVFRLTKSHAVVERIRVE